jgi:hypothetical protein
VHRAGGAANGGAAASNAPASSNAPKAEAQPMTEAAQAAQRHGLEMHDEDLVKLKADFDAVCKKHNFQNEAMSSKLADFLTGSGSSKMEAGTVAEEFGMELQDANTFLMWIQIGTKFKSDVIDRNAQLAKAGKL